LGIEISSRFHHLRRRGNQWRVLARETIRLLRSIGLSALVAAVLARGARAETVALWLFDDPPGAPVALDSSGHGYHLTLGPGAALVPGGKFGGALDPHAIKDDTGSQAGREALGAYRYHAEKALNPGDEDWTLECWAKAERAMVDDNRIWGLSGVNYIDLGRRVGKEEQTGLFIASRFLPIDKVTGWNKPTGNLRADLQFHHLAFVYDAKAKELRHYYDGKLQFNAQGTWKDVYTGGPPYDDAVFPPHYPMLQIGMRDALQQWSHRELHATDRFRKKFQGLLDEMRFSNAALYKDDFTPPASFARPGLPVWPQPLELAGAQGRDAAAQASLILETGPEARELTLTPGADWLTVDPVRSQPSQQIRVQAALTRLAPGRHETTLKVSAQGLATRAIPVLVTIARPESVRDVGDRKQLFIDRRFIEQSANVTLSINPPEKFAVDFEHRGGPMLCPWNVFYDEGRERYRMYYLADHLWCLESDDGVHWQHVAANGGKVLLEGTDREGRPVTRDAKGHPFGVTSAPPIRGQTGSPVKPMCQRLVYDLHDVPQRRYKLFQEIAFTHPAAEGDGRAGAETRSGREMTGVYGYYSADGLNFKPTGVRVLPILPEGVFSAFWDETKRKYVIYLRCENARGGGLVALQGNQFLYRPGFDKQQPNGFVDAVGPESGSVPGFENLRSIARLEADDLLRPWTGGVARTAERDTLYATSEQVPVTLAADPWDGFKDLYTGFAMKYPDAEDVYLMFLQTFRHFHPSRQPWFPGFADANGPLQGVLAVSRDGQHWDRVDRREYIPLGLMDEWDRHRTVPGPGIIKVGNYLYQYYWGKPQLHDTVPLREEYAKLEPEWSKVGIGGLRQRLDGYVSADVDYRGGWLTTPPIVFRGRRLVLNQNSGGQGMIFVELRDLNDRPIPGYSLADCEEVSCNDVAWEVRWRGQADVSALAGRAAKLHFRMTSAKLYAFQFVGDKTRGETGPGR
jgi:hypothetical protein